MENRVCASDVNESSVFPLLWDSCREKLDPEDFCQEAVLCHVSTGSVDLHQRLNPESNSALSYIHLAPSVHIIFSVECNGQTYSVVIDLLY